MPTDRRSFLAATAASAGLLPPLVAAADGPGRTGRAKNTKFAVNIEMWFKKVAPFHKRIEEAAKLGFPGVEYWDWTANGKDLTALADTAARHDVTITQFTAWGFKPGLNDPANHNQFVEKVERSCEAAKKLKMTLMTVVAGDDIPGVSQERMHENVVAGLKRAVPVCEKHGVTMILEPMNVRVDHKGHCLYGSAPAIRIVKAVGSKWLKLNWDLYHMHITEGDLCGHLREGFAAGAIAYVQLADHPGRNEPGTGEVHYPRVLQELKRLKYDGWVGLECNPKGSEAAAAKAVLAADNW